MQPLSIVESRAFRSVLEKAEPRYTMPSRKHLSSKLLTARYSEVRSSVEHLLHLAPQIWLTVDIWSNRQMKSYLGVTGHFIIDFTLHSVMLSCRRFRGSHTGEEILGYFLDIKDSFNISGKVKNIITDNASNMKKAFRLLETQVDEDDNEDEEGDDTLQPVELTEELDLLPTHHPCFSHTIQLVVKDGLDNADQVKRVLGKITRLVSHEEYFSSPCIPEDADPLIYWKHHQLSYPILSKLACHFLQVHQLSDFFPLLEKSLDLKGAFSVMNFLKS